MEIYRITGRGLIRCPFKASRVLDLLPKGQWTVEHGPGPPNYCSIKGLHRTVLLTFLDMACWISYMNAVQSANIANLYEHIIERQRAWLLGAASPDCLSPPRLYTLTGGGGEDGRRANMRWEKRRKWKKGLFSQTQNIRPIWPVFSFFPSNLPVIWSV